MTKLLNTKVSTTNTDKFRRRLLDCGLSSVSLFYCELMGREEIKGQPSAALARDVHALYKSWCVRLGIRPCTLPRFVAALRKHHGVASERLRYTIDGKQMGPHGVLVLSQAGRSLSTQIADFRQFAAKIHDGALT